MNALRRRDLGPDPFHLFARWFAEAELQSGREAAESACLATLGDDRRPEARMVLVKAFDVRGFVLFTGLDSAKARAVSAHPHAALLFYWTASHRQVRIPGDVARVTDEEADTYFATRPRESRLAAWASRQSAPFSNREELEAAFHAAARRFEGADVPRPPHWGGFRLSPVRFEFWQAGEHRLHDRFLYTRDTLRGGETWERTRLGP